MIASVGKSLIERRRALGLCLDDVAHASRVSRQNLRWLEADELSHFPNLAYALAFLRFYGGVLGLDVDDLTAKARAQAALMHDEQTHAAAQPRLSAFWTSARRKTRHAPNRTLEKAGSVFFAVALSVVLAAAGLTVAGWF